MYENELDSYRFTSDHEPSVTMLTSLIEEACSLAKTRSEKALKDYFDSLLAQAESIEREKKNFNLENISNNHKLSNKPYLIVIGGPNGSGKTTLTTHFLSHNWNGDAQYINPDIVAQEMFGDWNSPEAVLKAARHCVTLREECLSNHKDMIIETVLSTPRNVNFIERALSQGYYVRLFFISTEDPVINALRVARRVMEGGHDVPISKIISRYPKAILNCRRLSGSVNQLYVFDNSRDGEEARLLFCKQKGRLMRKFVEEVPLWAQPIL